MPWITMLGTDSPAGQDPGNGWCICAGLLHNLARQQQEPAIDLPEWKPLLAFEETINRR